MTPPPLATAAVPMCPDGHGPMVRKHGRTGEFFSCSQYPACRRTTPVPLDLPCPRCQAPLVVRAAKKSGKRFTGCSRYPACEYVVWAEPHRCGSCGRSCLGPEDERGGQPSVPPGVGGDHDDEPGDEPQRGEAELQDEDFERLKEKILAKYSVGGPA